MRRHARPGPCFLYVLRMSGAEDLLKVGISADPVTRWSAFHRRWFEAFDLAHSPLVEAETRGDAQRLETALHRALKAHACPVPLTMRAFAGGASEWFRGAATTASDFVAGCADAGFIVHADARAQVAATLHERQYLFASVLDQLAANARDGVLAPEQIDAVRDLAEAHRAFGADLSGLAPGDVLRMLGLHV